MTPPAAVAVAAVAVDVGQLPDSFYADDMGLFKIGPVAWTVQSRPAEQQQQQQQQQPASTSPKKKKVKPVDTMEGMSPAMRKMIRRGMAKAPVAKEAKELSPEQLDEKARREQERILRRKVLEFWSKQPHGFTAEDLYCVRTINLNSCSLTDDDGEALASVLTKEMVQLKQLDLFGNRLHDTAMLAMAAAFGRGAAPLITHLLLGRNAISDVGMKAFVRVLSDGALPRLQKLGLEHNLLGSEAAECLAKAAADGAAGVNGLSCLTLSGNPIGDGGFAAIASVCQDDEVWPRLTDLHLCATGVGDKGLCALAETLMPKCGGLPGLRTLLVDEEHLEHRALQQAREARTGHGGVHAIHIQSF